MKPSVPFFLRLAAVIFLVAALVARIDQPAGDWVAWTLAAAVALVAAQLPWTR